MKILNRLYRGSGDSLMRTSSQRLDKELPMDQLYKLLWTYYLNNGLYDELRDAGYYLDNTQLKELRNPAKRSVEFFVDLVWPGRLDNALPIVEPGNDAIIPAIEQIWDWSNWQARKQVAVRWAAVTGNVYFRVARPLPKREGEEAPKRVYIQLIRPEYVTKKETDERDYLVYVRLDIPQEIARGRDRERYTHTEVWDPERLRIWHHTNQDRHEEDLGEPVYEVELKDWGLDFIPIVHAKHVDLGEEDGIGAFTLELSKINELNRIATRLHQILYRHNDVTWALQSNMMDATGRPMPAPRIRSSSNPGSDAELDTIELGGEKLIRLPGQATLQPLIPNLDYGSHLEAVEAMSQELEKDLPQLTYYKLKDLPELSGKALRLMLTPALATASEVRGNLEAALIRAHKMALTIGNEIGAFDGIGSYAAGDYDHQFADRALIGLDRLEVAELAAAEVGSGIPLITSLRASGWTEEELAQLEEDKDAEQSAQQSTLASALMSAQDSFNSGQGSNGLEQPTGPVDAENDPFGGL